MEDHQHKPPVTVQREGVPAVKIVHNGGLLAVRHLSDWRSNRPSGEPVEIGSFGMGDAAFFAIHLRPAPRSELWRDGRHLGSLSFQMGSLQVVDQRHNWRARFFPPFDTVNFRVGFDVIAAAAEERGHRASDIHRRLHLADHDSTMVNLAQRLAPAFHRPHELTRLVADHIGLLVVEHVLDAYTSSFRRDGTGSGLAPWQVNRSLDMLRDSVDGELSIAQLAAECRLSPGHFARAFRRSVGMPPHRWLLIEKAKRAAQLLAETPTPIDQVAYACGFSDQSHLNRVFSKVYAMLPGAWRRIHWH